MAGNRNDLMKKVLNDEIDYDEFGEELSASATQFLKLALEKDPSKRASASKLLKHKWIKTHVEQNKVDDAALVEKLIEETRAFDNMIHFMSAKGLQKTVLSSAANIIQLSEYDGALK